MMIKRTTSDEPDFQKLAGELESDLKTRDGDEHVFYAQLNKIDRLKHVVVVYQQSEPVGCGAFRAYEEDSVEIKRMYVQPAYRGQKIGASVLDALENWARELNVFSTVLETGNKQLEAIHLYRKSGYIVMENYGPYKNMEESICMCKPLVK